MKNISVDIAYERLLADLEEYGDKKKAEEACKRYAEEKKKQRRNTHGNTAKDGRELQPEQK